MADGGPHVDELFGGVKPADPAHGTLETRIFAGVRQGIETSAGRVGVASVAQEITLMKPSALDVRLAQDAASRRGRQASGVRRRNGEPVDRRCGYGSGNDPPQARAAPGQRRQQGCPTGSVTA